MEITDTTVVAASIERMWALTVDVEALPSITPTITSVERLDDGPLRVGSAVRLTQPGLPARVWTVDTIDAPHRFRWSTRLLGVRMAGVHDLEPVGEDRCRLTLRVVLEGRGARLLGRLGHRNLARALAAEGAGFARAAATTKV